MLTDNEAIVRAIAKRLFNFVIEIIGLGYFKNLVNVQNSHALIPSRVEIAIKVKHVELIRSNLVFNLIVSP
jgi:hypothetical protein